MEERNLLDSPAQTLPDDLLAAVLGRLPPRSLAVSRCVCTVWRAAIDGRRLLRRDLLPLSLAGVFVNYISEWAYSFAELFSSPSPSPEKDPLVSSRYRYPPYTGIDDHCNGLLLRENAGVLNPATGWRTAAALPECPRPAAHAGMEKFWQDSYLVFDPTTTVPSQFEVFLVPRVPEDNTIGIDRETLDEYEKCGICYKGIQIDEALLASQWPPSPYVLNVFSSATGRWEERAFRRDGGEEGAGTVADMRVDDHFFMRRRNAVYFRGALYVHCECDFVMRLSFSTNKYRMIKPPLPTVVCNFPEFHLGKSENGIYFALLGDEAELWVWILAETKNGQGEEWRLRRGTGAGVLLSSLNCIITNYRQPWISHLVTRREQDKKNAQGEHNDYESNSAGNDEEEIIPHTEDNEQTDYNGYLEILAFHPYKEILFLHRSMTRGLAYHLNSAELEDLGDLSPKIDFMEKVGSCFPYTPCWI